MGKNTVRGVCVTLFAAASLALSATPALAGPVDTAAPLALVGTDTLSIVGKPGEDEAKTAVFVVNEGGKMAVLTQVTFNSAAAMGVDVRAGRATAPGKSPQVVIPGGKVSTLGLTFTGLGDLKRKVEGVLVISGGAKPVTRAVEITPTLKPARNWAHDIPVYSLWAGAGLAVISIFWMLVKGGPRRLFAPAPGPKWSLDSWATTLTAAGAVFGTVLGSVTLPDVPTQIDKDTLVTLNLLFGLLLLAGPFTFQCLRRRSVSPLDQDAGLWGSNITLLFAACFTYAAVAGEIATLGVLFWEILDGGTWGHVAKWIAVAAEALAAYYFLVTIPRVAAADWPELQRLAALQADQADRERMREFARILHRELSPQRVAELEGLAVPVTTDELEALTNDLRSGDPDRAAEANRRLRLLREPTDDLVGPGAQRIREPTNTFRRWALP